MNINSITIEQLNSLKSRANSGDVDAQSMVGMYYSYHNDDNSAVYWFRKAAEKNDRESQFLLGCILLDGKIGRTDEIYNEGMHWMCCAQINGLKKATDYFNNMIENSRSEKDMYEAIQYNIDKVKINGVKYVPENNSSSYKTNSYNNSHQTGGCYIATAVYGSYNCPQVWVLRRYRDYNLYKKWYGRIFIKFYYYISPNLVKHFGNTKLFNTIFKNNLDKIVASLMKKGYKDTPYNDRL